jgi:DNA-3-methyladenine glycosylase
MTPESFSHVPARQLDRTYFARDAVAVARELVGAVLLVDGVGGVIVETEAYARHDAASHSFAGATSRNEAMFGPPGHAYVYRSYGIHWCLNFVCEPGSAVLVRALEPWRGVDVMRLRRGAREDSLLCAGPGRLCQALGITMAQNGAPLDRTPFSLSGSDGTRPVAAGKRIGITRAVDLPWRFGEPGSRFLSRPLRSPGEERQVD